MATPTATASKKSSNKNNDDNSNDNSSSSSNNNNNNTLASSHLVEAELRLDEGAETDVGAEEREEVGGVLPHAHLAVPGGQHRGVAGVLHRHVADKVQGPAGAGGQAGGGGGEREKRELSGFVFIIMESRLLLLLLLLLLLQDKGCHLLGIPTYHVGPLSEPFTKAKFCVAVTPFEQE